MLLGSGGDSSSSSRNGGLDVAKAAIEVVGIYRLVRDMCGDIARREASLECEGWLGRVTALVIWVVMGRRLNRRQIGVVHVAVAVVLPGGERRWIWREGR